MIYLMRMPHHHSDRTTTVISPKKLLLIRTSAFGDVIQTFYVLSDLQRARPATEITWCVDQRFADLARQHPAAHHVIELPTRRWKNVLKEPHLIGEMWSWRKTLRQIPYDVSVDLQGLYKSALVGFASRAGLRIGPEAFGSSERGVHYLYQRHIKGSKMEGLASRARYFVGAALGYEPFAYRLDSGIRHWRGGDHITLMVGASTPQKCWPTPAWVSLCSELIAQYSEPIELLWGSAAEREIAANIVTHVNSSRVTVAPQVYDVEGLRQRFLQSRLMVGGDTGLVHFAAALGVPTVMLFLKTGATRYTHPELATLLPVDHADGPVTPGRVFNRVAQAMQMRGA